MFNKEHSSSAPSSLRRTHRALVLARIQAKPGISRADLARSLGFSEMAATRIIRELISAGLVEEMDVLPPKQPPAVKRLGRPKIGLRIVGEGLYAAGITVSAYYSEVSICDANGVLKARERLAFFVSDDIAETASYYAEALGNLIAASGVDPRRIVGVGIALAARTSLDKGEIVRSDYFGWGADGGAFRREVARRIRLPIEIDNISNALAIAEMRFGAARGASDFVLVHVATLVGAAVICGGRLARGKDGVSGMLGHFRAAKADYSCVCGRNDCLNVSATGFAVLANMGKLPHPDFDRTRLEDYASALLELVESGEAVAEIRKAGACLAPALDSVCKLLGPEMVILSGFLGADTDYIGGVRSGIEAEFLDGGPEVPIVRGTISPMQAASLLALHTFCYSDRLDFDRFAGDEDEAATSGTG